MGRPKLILTSSHVTPLQPLWSQQAYDEEKDESYQTPSQVAQSAKP
jgi:hypothetical protein